jgi:ankyrin repeat protein
MGAPDILWIIVLKKESYMFKQTALGLVLLAHLLVGTACGDDELNKALYAAVTSGDKAQVEALITKGADVDAKVGFLDWTMLRWAAKHGHADVVIALLDKGADVNAKDKGGLTVLMGATISGRANIVKILIKKGADVNIKTATGETALSYAAEGRHGEIVRILKEAGAK